MNILVSGLVNIETTLRIEQFPVNYYPIDYPFFGIKSGVGGVAYNVAKALHTLGCGTEMISFIGNDDEGQRILRSLDEECIGHQFVSHELAETPVSVVLYDKTGRRQVYCDLKDIQNRQLDYGKVGTLISGCDLVAACNINFNRNLIREARKAGKTTATDVHVLSDPEDSYNKDFMENADILFLSDEQLPCDAEEFLTVLKRRYDCKIIVMGRGAMGALMYDRRTDCIFSLKAVQVDKVVNTVGAGDALFAGFLHYYGKGYEPLEALKRAEIFAAVKIGYNGASEGFCSENEVERIYDEQAAHL